MVIFACGVVGLLKREEFAKRTGVSSPNSSGHQLTMLATAVVTEVVVQPQSHHRNVSA